MPSLIATLSEGTHTPLRPTFLLKLISNPLKKSWKRQKTISLADNRTEDDLITQHASPVDLELGTAQPQLIF